ncbi:hypothetical protein B0H15DRAFT_582751 [Mycena belliarum]|uniref:Uncharacterized protein n=1 Tax=Mycena belliarum TaxID=1033014 RepID=A0AAD6XTJ3_9AGAR|nr:hypothetical protein B0H15DRAFT_582751 [Mycena belliae]
MAPARTTTRTRGVLLLMPLAATSLFGFGVLLDWDGVGGGGGEGMEMGAMDSTGGSLLFGHDSLVSEFLVAFHESYFCQVADKKCQTITFHFLWQTDRISHWHHAGTVCQGVCYRRSED